MLLMVLAAGFASLCVLAAIRDISSLTIPNWINAALALLFVPAALVSGLPVEMIGGHLLAGLLAFLVAFALFTLRLFGGGDAKMIAAVILWMGPSGVLPFIVWMALAGGALALLVLSVRRSIPATLMPGFMRAPFEPDAGLPYGVAIAAGALLASPHSAFLSVLPFGI